MLALLCLAGTASALPAQEEPSRSLVPHPQEDQARQARPSHGMTGPRPAPDGAPMPPLEVSEAAPPRVADLDDGVPLPRLAVIQETPQGDVVLEPASGDPHFLGFAAGNHFPPAGERLDPDLLARARAGFGDGRPAQEAYAFVMFALRMTAPRVAELEQLGVRFIDFHPHYALKAAIPADALQAVAAHPAVRWVGTPRRWQRVHPALAKLASVTEPGATLAVWINVYDSDLNPASVVESYGAARTVAPGGIVQDIDPEDLLVSRWRSNGWQQAALEQAGVEVGWYVDSIRAFRAEFPLEQLEAVLDLEFVQFVEPDVEAELFHDESMSMILADRTRIGATGGANQAAVLGIVDSGVDIAHAGFSHIFGVGWNLSGSGTSPWTDPCGHGSHVGGTMFGNASINASLAGAAPGLGWGATGRIFNVRIFNTCAPQGVDLAGVLDLVHTAYTDGANNTTQRPHVINHSWGASPTDGTNWWTWVGTEANARLLDTDSNSYAQFHVFAAGNSGNAGTGTIGLPAVAKNAFAVANVRDYGNPGELWTSSSTGPAGDGRWKPNIAAPGRWIRSVNAGTGTGYVDNSGTSMASPHVAGVAAQLVDVMPAFRYLPERLASLLMATAVTKDNGAITTPSTPHLRTYGAGRVEAFRSHFGTSQTTWNNWGFSLSSGQWTFGDFTVPAGTTRIVVVMNYYENAASSGASQALVNNWDLWLDQDPIDPAGNTGEWFAHQSSVDNTEIRILNNPAAGPWRWKVWPTSTSTTAYFGVTVSFISGSTTPSTTLTLTPSDVYLKPNEQFDLTASLLVPSYLASAVYFRSTQSAQILQALMPLQDGAVANLITNPQNGIDLQIGDVMHGTSQSATWRARYSTEGQKLWTVRASADNMADRSEAVSLIVDGTPPTLVTNLTSSTHTPGVWSTNGSITYVWTPATDSLSGVDGYGIFTSTGAPSLPAQVLDIGPVSSYNEVLASSAQARYFNIRTVDRSGNWTAGSASTGGYLIDTVAPTPVTNLISTSHTVGQASCSSNLMMSWTASTDAHSGLSGYIHSVTSSSSSTPSGPNTIGPGATSHSVSLPAGGPWYFHIRPRDVAGNLGATRHAGPYFVTAPPTVYCTAEVNSLGCTPQVGTTGVPSYASSSFRVNASQVLNNRNGLFFWGTAPASIPFNGGTLCVATPVVRAGAQNSGGNPPPASDCSGTFSYHFTSAYMASYGIVPGNVLYGQYWSRDPASTGGTNLTNAVRFTICP